MPVRVVPYQTPDKCYVQSKPGRSCELSVSFIKGCACRMLVSLVTLISEESALEPSHRTFYVSDK